MPKERTEGKIETADRVSLITLGRRNELPAQLDKIKVLRGTPKHLSKTGSLDAFTYLMMTLPFECNYHCPKCFNLPKGQPEIPRDPLTLSERLRLVDEAKDLGVKAVVIAGEGEPSISIGIRPLVTKINKNGMIPIIYSNGSPLNSDLISFYRSNNTSLVISFDSLDPTTYDKLTSTKGMLERVKKNISLAVEANQPLIERTENIVILRVAINTTVTSLNEHEVENIKSYFGESIYFICNPLARLGNAVGNWDNLITDAKTLQRQAELIRKLSESGGPLTLGSDGLCNYSAWGISVNPSGDYMTCAYTNLTWQLNI